MFDFNKPLSVLLVRLFSVLVAAVVLLSLTIAIYPDPPARPLLKPNDIIIESGFSRTDSPKDFEARQSIRQSVDLVTWRTWNPAQGSVRGQAHTKPFRVPPHMVVPYQGFAGDTGIRLYVECLSSGAQLDVAVARTNNQWAEAIVSRPSGWCAGPARLVAVSDSNQKYLSFGTPFRISTISWLKTTWLGLFGIWAALFAVIAGVCLAFALLLHRLWPHGDALAPGLIGFGVFGYCLFFVFQQSAFIGSIVSILMAVASFLALTMLWLARRSSDPNTGLASSPQSLLRAWRSPLAAWLVVSLGYLTLLYAVDNGAGAWLANARFAPVRWSTDNQLPMLVGEHLARLKLADLDLQPWLVSDRTPLAYGVHASLRSLTLWFTAGNDGFYAAPLVHTIIGIVINSAWVPVLVHTLRRLGLGRRKIGVAIATATLLPFSLFNSIYIWPKLLGGSFGLLAIWVLLIQPRSPTQAGDGRWLQAAMLSALAMLCHGGTVFGVVAMLVLAPFAVALPRFRELVGSGMAAATLLVPWSLWQKLVQPPGNALVKSVFAGTFGFDEPELGVIDTIRRSYAQLAPGEWLTMKMDAVRSLLLPATPSTCSYGEMVVGSSGVDAWRIVDFASLVPSIRFLWIGVLMMLISALRRQHTPVSRAAHLLLAAGTLGVVINALSAWDCQIIHTQSYQSILSIVAAMLLALLCLGPRYLGIASVALSIGYGIVVWIYGPLIDGLRIDPIAVGVGSALIVLVAWYLRNDEASRTEA